MSTTNLSPARAKQCGNCDACAAPLRAALAQELPAATAGSRRRFCFSGVGPRPTGPRLGES